MTTDLVQTAHKQHSYFKPRLEATIKSLSKWSTQLDQTKIEWESEEEGYSQEFSFLVQTYLNILSIQQDADAIIQRQTAAIRDCIYRSVPDDGEDHEEISNNPWLQESEKLRQEKIDLQGLSESLKEKLPAIAHKVDGLIRIAKGEGRGWGIFCCFNFGQDPTPHLTAALLQVKKGS